MTIIFDGPPDERPIMERLARMVAHLSGDSWKSAHTILQDALTKPAKPDGLRDALKKLTDVIERNIEGCEEWRTGGKVPWIPGANFQDGEIDAAIQQAHKALDADSARRNVEANKPTFPNGRIGSKGGI